MFVPRASLEDRISVSITTLILIFRKRLTPIHTINKQRVN